MLLPGFLAIARETGLPLEIAEIGASAGLNLNFDRYHYRYGAAEWGDPASPVRLAPELRGKLPPLDGALTVSARSGCDIAPVDLSNKAARLRLRCFIWADQTARLQRLDAAIGLALAAPVTLVQADAADFVRQKLAAAIRRVGLRGVSFGHVGLHAPPNAGCNQGGHPRSWRCRHGTIAARLAFRGAAGRRRAACGAAADDLAERRNQATRRLRPPRSLDRVAIGPNGVKDRSSTKSGHSNDQRQTVAHGAASPFQELACSFPFKDADPQAGRYPGGYPFWPAGARRRAVVGVASERLHQERGRPSADR